MNGARRPGRSWCDEAKPLPSVDEWLRMSEFAQHVSKTRPPPTSAAELRARMNEQLRSDALIYGTSFEKEHADGSRERVHPAAVLCYGKQLLEVMPGPSLEPDPMPAVIDRVMASRGLRGVLR